MQCPLQSRHNECDCVPSHRRLDYLLDVFSGADQRKHQSSASLAFVRGIHRWPVNSPHKRPVTRKMFSFDDVIMRWSDLGKSTTKAYIIGYVGWQLYITRAMTRDERSLKVHPWTKSHKIGSIFVQTVKVSIQWRIECCCFCYSYVYMHCNY